MALRAAWAASIAIAATLRLWNALAGPVLHGYDGWAVLEWECCLKHPENGAREGAPFIADHIIRVTDKAFDDFADAGTDDAANRRMLGIN